MNNLKICIFLSVLLLTACSAPNVPSQASASIDSGNSTSDVADVQSEHSGELSLVTSYLGPDSEASTEDFIKLSQIPKVELTLCTQITLHRVHYIYAQILIVYTIATLVLLGSTLQAFNYFPFHLKCPYTLL